jgi:hypothetical protein
MLKKKKKKGDMVFKLDVEKANDKVDLIRVSLNKP